jgi:hypothetical protein
MAAKQTPKSNPQPAKSNPQPATRSNTPPPKTQEEKKVQQVNQLVKEGKITKNEGNDLKDKIRDSANKDGQLSNKESKEINKEIEKDKKDKGDGKDDRPAKGGPDKGKPDKGGPDKPPGGGGGGGGGQPPPVLDDGKINQKDIDALFKLINELQTDVKKLKEENKTLKNELDSLSELAADGGGSRGDGGGDDSVEDDATSSTSDVPTTRSATGTIDANIPKTNFGADISYPKDAERIWMPNIDTKVKKEVDRITMSLIKSTREFLEAGIDYDGINQVPKSSGFEGDLLYTDPLENNQSEPNESALASEVLLAVTDILTKEFEKSDPNSTNYYYIRFLEFFELNYNASGEPYYDLNININNDIIESLKAIVVKVDEDGIETRVAEGE